MISDLIDRPIRAENICYCENRRTLMVDSRRRKPLLPYLWHISLRFSRFLFTIYLLYQYIHNFTRPSDQQQCTQCYHQGKTKVHPVFVVKSYDLNCLLLNPCLCKCRAKVLWEGWSWTDKRRVLVQRNSPTALCRVSSLVVDGCTDLVLSLMLLSSNLNFINHFIAVCVKYAVVSVKMLRWITHIVHGYR